MLQTLDLDLLQTLFLAQWVLLWTLPVQELTRLQEWHRLRLVLLETLLQLR